MLTKLNKFRILKTNSHQLIITDTNTHKYLYRQLKITNQFQLNHLTKLVKLNHPSLIKLHHIYWPNCSKENSEFIVQSIQKTPIGLLVQHYTSKLNINTPIYQNTLTHQEIFNTFQPIEEVLLFLIQNECCPNNFSMRNIVITENEQIKFIDSLLLQNPLKQYSNQMGKYIAFQKLSQIIFESIFPFQQTKSWKSRVKILKNSLSNHNYSIFMRILCRSLKNVDIGLKTKKIRKSCKKYKNLRKHIGNKIM